MICQAIEKRLKAAVSKGEIRANTDVHVLAVMILAMLNGQISLGEKLNNLDVRKQMTDSFLQLICS